MEITLLVNSQNTKKIAKINSQSDGNNIVGKQSKHTKKQRSIVNHMEIRMTDT